MARGFSIVELLLALALTIGLGVPMLHVFAQARQVFRDQNLVLEMRQTARAVAAMLEEDLRRAGQGVPLFARRHAATSTTPDVFLQGTDTATARFRVGPARVDRLAGAPPDLTLRVGEISDLTLDAPGGAYDAGTHLFLWGRSGASWTWVRARVEAFDARRDILSVRTVETSSEGGRMTSPPALTEEDAVSWRRVGESIRRGELSDFPPSGAGFREMSVGEGFTALEFLYRGEGGAPLDPGLPDERDRILEVEVRIEARTSERLANGDYAAYSVRFSVVPRNAQVSGGWL